MSENIYEILNHISSQLLELNRKVDSLTPEVQSSVFTVEEASEYIGVGKTRMYELLQDGKIESKKNGSRYIITKQSLDKWLRDTDDINDTVVYL